MSNYYAITVKVTFGVLADSEDEAESIARHLVPTDEIPARAIVSYEAGMTLNQNDYVKRGAVNA